MNNFLNSNSSNSGEDFKKVQIYIINLINMHHRLSDLTLELTKIIKSKKLGPNLTISFSEKMLFYLVYVKCSNIQKVRLLEKYS